MNESLLKLTRLRNRAVLRGWQSGQCSHKTKILIIKQNDFRARRRRGCDVIVTAAAARRALKLLYIND
jgi:hypothetical protein